MHLRTAYLDGIWVPSSSKKLAEGSSFFIVGGGLGAKENDGIIDGKSDGFFDRDGKIVGLLDGDEEKLRDGEAEGGDDGKDDGFEEGTNVGISENIFDGIVDGIFDGIVDGIVDGALEWVKVGERVVISGISAPTKPTQCQQLSSLVES